MTLMAVWRVVKSHSLNALDSLIAKRSYQFIFILIEWCDWYERKNATWFGKRAH